LRHCEERSDEAIQRFSRRFACALATTSAHASRTCAAAEALDCFASLAMLVAAK
jgi:hypothetical protein